ncbi:MAG: GH92 family glycosyl hydrolase [Muribaculaceae bacterium]|nr:GH92 family glycosyl hydrolase [Muribaculaceae bacterium]
MVSILLALSSLLGYVDTRVGTAEATTMTAGLFGKGSEEHGQTVPAVCVPHGMTLWTPQTRDTEEKCIAPYYYADTDLQGFRASHWISGGCTQDYGSVSLAALDGDLRTSPLSRATRLDRESETARPDYYSVSLPDESLKAEMTGLSRAGIFRFTYDTDGIGHLVVNPNTDEGAGWIEIDTIRREIRGCNPVHRIYQGWGEPAGFSGWFVVRYPEDLDVVSAGVFRGDEVYEGSSKAEGSPGIGGYVSFKRKKDVPVTVKVGNSFTSLDGARLNLDSEIQGWDFDAVRALTAKTWDSHLGKIEVEGGSDEDKGKFYGSLYRASLLPRVVSDVDGSYVSFAGSGDHPSEIMKMEPGRDYYDDYSMWDTYRAEHPLITILDTKRSADMMYSLVLKARQGEWMPIFPCWGSYTAAMIGDHCSAAIADAAAKGVTDFPMEEAYAYLRKNAFESPASRQEYVDGKGRRALESYLKYGYIPLEDGVEDAFHKKEQTSRTLEYAFDDFALSRLARQLGHDEDAEVLEKRSQNYRNVIDPKVGYANGRHADGTWADSINPFTFNPFITEGAPCHYTWYVPHDPEGLIDILGGKEMVEAKLDSLFELKRYWHGNEPCHQIVYLYDAVDRPDKAAKWIRHIMDTEYKDIPGGLSGNDDAGQMSAWYVFSAMGFYPVCPGLPEYWLGAPLFDKVTIHTGSDTSFTIEKSGSDGAPRLNGHPLDSYRLPHSALTSGSTLRF